MILVLEVEPKEAPSFSYRCTEPSVVIGRSNAATLAIPSDRFLSRRHARLFQEEGSWYVEDLDSQNSTILNGKPVIAPMKLRVGDTILMSDCALRVRGFDSGESEALTADGDIYQSASAILADSDSGKPPRKEDGELQKLTARLQVLHHVHQALAAPLSLHDLLEMILDRSFAALNPEEASIFLMGADGKLFRAAARRLPGLEGRKHFFSERLAREVTTKRVAALVLDARDDERFRAAESFVGSGVRSVIAAPLLDPEDCLGMLVLSSRTTVRKFSREDMELLTSLASVAALRLRYIALAEESVRRRELDRELDRARQIQVSLLPERLPAIEGYRVHAKNVPSRTVSGDLYRFEERRKQEELSVLIADVSGKGLAASLLTASLEALAAGPMEMGRSPDDVLEKLSRRLFARTAVEKFATAATLTLKAPSGIVGYASAGHLPLLWLRSGGVTRLDSTGVPLGLFPEAEYGLETLELSPGESLVLYTDGIVEATNRAGDDYGLDRLESIVGGAREEEPETIVAAVDRDLAAFVEGVPYDDDRTLVILRRND